MSYFSKIQGKHFTIILLFICLFVIPTKARASATSCASNIAATLLTSAISSYVGTAATQATTHSVQTASIVAGETATGAQMLVGVPISNPSADILLGGISFNANMHSGFQDVTKMSLDSLAYAAGQCALDLLTESTVAWIKGGFTGSPSFAMDPTKLFLDTANMVSGGMASEILGIATCDFYSLFKVNLANSVSLSTRSGYQSKFSDQIRCPFPSGINAQGFYDDFKNGGWRAFEASLSDSGNPFGTKMLVSQELATRQAETADIKKQELGWAGGFLSLSDSSDPSKCAYPEGMDPDFNDFTGLARTASEKSSINNTYCPKTTPGKIISDTLSKSIGTDMDKLGFADNMNKIISALVSSLTSSVTTGIFRQGSSGSGSGSATNTIIRAVIIGSTSGSKATTVVAGATNQFANDILCVSSSACSAFTIILSSGTGTLTSIKVTESGGVNASTDLSNLALFYNTSGNFAGGRTQYGSTVPNFTTLDTATVTGSLPLTPGIIYYFYVRFDSRSLAGTSMPTLGQTVDFTIATNPDVVVTGGAATTGAPKSLLGLTTFN